ncbi:N-methyl-L-tryptophan oxidase [Paenibacillus albiflavus]|uniref:N-methyl-L-tryptophan oxidase n=1 Tax=Paenibacillus albiflavus TaxID=2545760 RepID=A0A4R4EID2_9BACL|nr:N-methyl-L-tryptophan oxidase [Paenibacillus albiflavus]TCZ79904.1 N-methyl-L-tryptophan oxidase [Paenibacillus albiflavus]
MRTSYDVIVVGSGAMGMSAGAQLAAQGMRTLLIDAYDPPHTNGSHHGDTRLIRHAYSEGLTYVPLALRAHELWHDLEASTGIKLFNKTGVLSIGNAGTDAIQRKLASAEAFSLPVEKLSSEEMQYRWKGLKVPESAWGCLETDAGVLYSEACVHAYRQQAAAYGAEFLMNCRVIGIDPSEAGVKVTTAHETFYAHKCILTTGASIYKHCSSLQLPVRAIRKTVAWFDAAEQLFASDRFPGFVVHESDGSEYYGFPSIDGQGIKVGRHDTGVTIDPDEPLVPFGSYEEDEAVIHNFMLRYMPSAAAFLKRGSVCKYEVTPDEDFIIQQHPVFPSLILAGGFSGHGFKFASVVGEIINQLASSGRTDHDIAKFSLARFQ